MGFNNGVEKSHLPLHLREWTMQGSRPAGVRPNPLADPQPIRCAPFLPLLPWDASASRQGDKGTENGDLCCRLYPVEMPDVAPLCPMLVS
jgi:hypothetical protein